MLFRNKKFHFDFINQVNYITNKQKIQQENKKPVSEANSVQPDEITAMEKAIEAKSKFYEKINPFFDLQPLHRHYREFRKMPKPKDADAKNDNDVKNWLNQHQVKYEKFKNHIKE